MVSSSSLAGLAAGLACREVPPVPLLPATGCPIRDLLRAGLPVGLFCVCALGRAVFFGTAAFFAVVVAAGVFSGVIDGVALPPAARRTA